MKRSLFATLIALALFLAPGTAFAATECTLQGQGTSSDPYLISSEADLIHFRTLINEQTRSYQEPATYDGAYFALTCDIELTDAYNSAQTPIGSGSANAFYGNFDGRGHVISGLSMKPSSNYAGLFGYVGGSNQKDTVLITRLGVKGAINGAANVLYNVGGLVGFVGSNSSYAVTISQCYTKVDISGYYALGGIVGYAGSNTYIENCLAEGSITGADKSASSPNKQMGGIAGFAGGTSKGAVSNCLFTGQITPASGAVNDMSSVKTQHETCNGIVGYTSGSAAQQPLSGCLYVQQDSSAVKAVHYGPAGISATEDATRVVDPTAEDFDWNAVVASLNGGETTAASAWVVSQGAPRLAWQAPSAAPSVTVTFVPSPGAFPDGVSVNDQGNYVVELQGSAALTLPVDPACAGMRFAGWCIDRDGNGQYSEGDTPYEEGTAFAGDTTLVARFAQRAVNTFVPLGEEGAPAGTAEDPFVISTEEDLAAFAASVNGKCVKGGAWVDTEAGAHDYAGLKVVLADDIELTSAFTPIGLGANTTSGFAQPTCFSGIFDGQGHHVKNLRITAASNPRVTANIHEALWFSAFFGAVNDATLINLVVELSPLMTYTVETLSAEAGAGLVAQVYGGQVILENCGVEGDLTGGAHALGGLVGRVDGGTLDMRYSYHRGAIETSNSAGGLFASASNAQVKALSCFQQGEVSSTSTSSEAARFYGQLGGTGSTATFTSCAVSSAAVLGGTNLTCTEASCLKGVYEWYGSAVQAALGTDRFVYPTDEGALCPQFGQAAVASYAVTFTKAVGVTGSVPTLGKQAVGSTVTIPASTLTLRGKVFAGWIMEGDASQTLYGAGDTFVMPDHEVIFEAQWGEIPATEVSTEAQLRAIVAAVNRGEVDSSAMRYVLTCDIALSQDWTPLGTSEYPFKGIFDGGNHVISALNVTDDTLVSVKDGRLTAGFFGYTEGATIQNVGVQGSISADDALFAGGLIGFASGTAPVYQSLEYCTTVTNCFARVNVASAGIVGGLVGQAQRTSFAQSYAAATLTLKAQGTQLGGLVGQYQSASLTNTAALAARECYSGCSLSSANENALVGALFGCVEEAYAKVSAGAAWTRLEAVYGLSGDYPAYYTRDTYGALAATPEAVDAGYLRAASTLKSSEGCQALGSAFKADAEKAYRQVNQGFPVLSWEQERAIETYTLAYVLYGGVWAAGYSAPATYTPDQETILPTGEELTKAGYEFVGWKTSPTAKDTFTTLPEGTTGNLTLYAWWRADTPRFTVGANPFAGCSQWVLVAYTGAVQANEKVQFKAKDMFLMGTRWVALMDVAEAKSLTNKDFALVDGESPAPVISLQGDINGNGKTNIVDAQVAYELALGHYTDFTILSAGQWLAADVNEDGQVDAADAFAIQRMVHLNA